MDFETGKTELQRHAGCATDYYEDGFVASLRPYIGLRERNFHQVVEAVLSVGAEFASSENVERSIVYSVFDMTSTARRWGVDEGGMLVRNRLITPEDRKRLGDWVQRIELMMLPLLAGQSPATVVSVYSQYVARYDWGENYAFFLPHIAAAIDSEETEGSLEYHCGAIAKLGKRGLPVADALLRAKKRKYSWYEPRERCDAEMQTHLDNAIASMGIVQ